MLLREYLEDHTRDELLDYARSIELKKCSGLRKAELIEKIVIHQTEKINGKKVQEIDIYYRGVGIISFPVSLEDMTMIIEKMINKRKTA